MMQATNLKTNHLTQPLGIDAGTLFLSWQCAEGVRQTAYEIEVTAGAETLWASGKALGSVMHTETPSAVPPKTQGRWRIRLWDENDQPGAWSTASFETGLAQADWQGVWVCPETEEPDIDCADAINAFAKPNWEQKQAALEASGKGQAQPYQPHRPASYLRKTFTAPAGESKRLYITAKGLYAAWLNGKRVGDKVLAPGSFTADKHLGAQTYDVTALVRDGEMSCSSHWATAGTAVPPAWMATVTCLAANWLSCSSWKWTARRSAFRMTTWRPPSAARFAKMICSRAKCTMPGWKGSFPVGMA